MGTQVAEGFCPCCGRQVLLHRQGPNHLLHLVLSIVTGGVWLIVWAALAWSAGVWPEPWRCTVCGAPAEKL